MPDKQLPSNTSGKQRNDKTQCIACRNDLPPGATFCDRCDSFQTAWKNTLLYAAKVISVVAVLASAIVFVISRSEDVRKFFFWQDRLQVLSFASDKFVTLANIGDGEVFISHIENWISHATNVQTTVIPIAKTIKAKEAIQHLISDQPSNVRFRYVGSMDDKPWQKAVQRAFSRNDPCFKLAVYYENDPIILQVKDAYKKNFRMLSATARLHFYSLVKGKMIIDSLSVIGMVLVEDNCQANVTGSGSILMPEGPK